MLYYWLQKSLYSLQPDCRNNMTPEQVEDLLIEWSIYSKTQQEKIINEYQKTYGNELGELHWLEYLKEALEIEDYWKKVGLI